MASPAPLVPAREGIIDAVQGGDRRRVPVRARTRSARSRSTSRARASPTCCASLRDELDYQQLMEIAGVDYPERPERFEVVYHLLSVTEEPPHPRQGLDRRGHAGADASPASMAGRRLARARGVRHVRRDLRRQSGPAPDPHRLRLSRAIRSARTSRSPAMSSCAIPRSEKRVVYEPVELPQDFRNFDFLSPWEGAEYRPARRREGACPRRPARRAPRPRRDRQGRSAEADSAAADAQDHREARPRPAPASRPTAKAAQAAQRRQAPQGRRREASPRARNR